MRTLAVLFVAGLFACSSTREEKLAASMQGAQDAKKKGDFETAAKELDAAVALDPENVTALRGLVEAYHRLGRLKELETRFNAAITSNPDDAFAHEGLGLALYARGGTAAADARVHLTKAIELRPKEADFHYRLGILVLENDEWAAAKESLAKAVELEPSKARYRIPLSTALARTGDRAGGVRELAKVLQLKPARDEVQLAEKTARQILDPFRGFPPAARERFDQAFRWLEKDATAQAQQILDELLESYPDLAVVHATSGLAALKVNDAGRGIASFRRAAEISPELAEPRLYLADVYMARSRADLALEHYEAAITRNPYLAEAQRRYAEALQKSGHKEDAAARYDVYLILRPDDFDALVARATLASELGRSDALATWDALVEAYPRRPDALVGASRYYLNYLVNSKDPETRQGAYDRARRCLERAVAIDPENATATAMYSQLSKFAP